MDPAKVKLSPKELELITNADWILTKNGILEKVKHRLGSLAARQQEFLAGLEQQLPAEILSISPKISKGENYMGLPYMILDYPRLFNKEHIAAIRTFFWWGNFFSTTLHLSGDYRARWKENIKEAYDVLQKEDYQLSVHDSEWEHHFEKTNYVAVKEFGILEFEQHIEEHSFIKLAKKTSLEYWEDAEEILFTNFKLLIHILQT